MNKKEKTNQNKVSEKVEPVLIRTILNVFYTQYAIWSANLVSDLHIYIYIEYARISYY